ncbi:DUF3800 domain-containing protein [Candidatus Thiosymbion oneisti]|uniref:DUF3800 domain-containing protein n=1 Tax=Candidatus Thiosymbion oneisti TaxID=589554 RepID=UPI000A975496|nr:DUF3800 domain-containing protein [Candidatus Thiosymbion oneisti]
MPHFSDYIIYVDESGDHGLKSIDPDYPVFVLAFCIFRKAVYSSQLVPALQEFKFHHFGHDQVILHEADIRKDRKEFAFLKTPKLKADFLNALTHIVAATPFTLICSVIDKDLHRRRYANPGNPYHIALGFGLERLFYFLRSQGAEEHRTHIIVERRGKQEDTELESEFRGICSGSNYEGVKLPFELIFADKKSNSSGLQMADLVARPVGIKMLRPDRENRAFEVLERKFYANGRGRRDGWGLKRFP